MNKKNKNKSIKYNDEIMFFDIETSNINAHDKEGNEYTIPQTYLWNIISIKESDLNKINKDNMQIIREGEQQVIDKNKIQVKSKFGRTLEEFINFTKILKNKTICYVHNLSYEFSYLVRETDNGLDDNYLNIFRNINDCLLSHLKDIPKVEFRDSLCLLRKSIKDLGEDIDCEKLEIDYERNLHYYDDLEDNDYDYNERDNIITMLSIAQFLQHKANLIGVKSVKNLPTTSTRYVKEDLKLFGTEKFPVKSKSSKIKNGYQQSKTRRNNSLDDDYNFYKTCKLAFRGGLVCSNPYYTPKYHGNKWLNDVYHIDITSSYVHVMLNNKFPYYSKKTKVEVSNKEKATKIIKVLSNKIKKYGSDYINRKSAGLIIDGKKVEIKGFYAHVTFKNIRLKNKYDIPSIDSAKTSAERIKKDSVDLERFCGKILKAKELSMTLNDPTLESIMIDYDFDDIQCDYIIYTTESQHLPYFELCYLTKEFFNKELLKPHKDESKKNEIEYLLCKSNLNGIYGIKVQDLIKNKITVENNQVVVSERAHTIVDNNDDNKKLFDENLKNRLEQPNIYSDGVYVSCKARLYLIKMKKHLKDIGCKPVYCDTDSLIFRIIDNTEKEVFDSIKEYNNKISKDLLSRDWIKKDIKMLSEIIDKDEEHITQLLSKIGNWDIESKDENGNIKKYELFSTLGPKKYCKVKNGKVETVVSGLSKDIGKLIENYAKQEKISVCESAKLIFKNNTMFDETCSGQTIIKPTTLDKKFIETLRDENDKPLKGYGGNLIEKTSFTLCSTTDTEGILHSELSIFAEKNMLTANQTVNIDKNGVITIR